MSEQLAIPMPPQPRASTKQSERIWEVIVSLRKLGYKVYRAGHQHKLITGGDGVKRSNRGRHLTTGQLLKITRKD